ncbi:glutamate ABC transporter substrate-binding protein [Luteipulveratus mongoliensis]|uniref:glutamate ABC transporter substrate-binding protein n=1 Tax=Luteipulveratus mongoliensis TaxID=571913 RepID=UPI001C54CB97|nr:glutamate ABC transporter substrate-binding protein [Luteipulveratus mongoliensis]
MSACSDGASPTPATSNGATGNGKITIGISGDLPGLSLKAGASYSGFDIDTANFVAGKLGVPSANITWKVIDQAERVSALTSGEVDLVVSTFSITPERQKEIDFAGPYFVAHQDLLIRRNDEEITGPDTLNDKTLCAAAGTTSADYVKAHYKGHITLHEVPTWGECVRNLANGDVDAVSTDDVLLAGFASLSKYKGELKLIGKGFTDERYGVGMKKGDAARLAKVNTALKEFISSGAWKKSLNDNVTPSGYSIPSAPKVGS